MMIYNYFFVFGSAGNVSQTFTKQKAQRSVVISDHARMTRSLSATIAQGDKS